VLRPDGTLLINGTMAAFDAFQRLRLAESLSPEGYHTVAGFALHVLKHIPEAGEVFEFGSWRFEIVDMDGMRIDKILATPASIDEGGI